MDLKELAIREPITAYEVLDRVVELIQEEPKRIRMGVFLWRQTTIQPEFFVGGLPIKVHADIPRCGTIGCVSGWCSIVLGCPDHAASWDFTDPVPRTLGLSQDQLWELFFPVTRKLDYSSTEMTGTPEYAQKVIRHIRGFQRRYEDQLRSKVVRPDQF